MAESTDPSETANNQYHRAIDILRCGGVVAVPTDTVYGLIAVAADRAAVERIYEIKARDPAQPMPLFAGSLEQAELIADLNGAARALAARFWPGALTIVVPKKPAYDTRAAAGGASVGVRVPDDAFLREAALQLGPLTGTSANIAGREECHTAAEVRAQLGDNVDLIVEAPLPVLRLLPKDPTREDFEAMADQLNQARAAGVPSTIVDCTAEHVVRVLREGAVAREAITSVVLLSPG